MQEPPASLIASTAAGPIEYYIDGVGPVVLGFHGTPGGYDQVALVSRPACEAGFRVIGWSRPGYLRTPIETGRTPAQQADAAVALLDALKIDRVCVSGASGGGPASYLFAARHPDRIWGLITECAISRRFGAELSRTRRILIRIGMNRVLSKLLDFIANHFQHLIVKQMVRVGGTLDRCDRRALDARVSADPRKTEFVQGLVRTFLPLRERKIGVLNDLAQFARIDALPLADIKCPALVIHGTTDADVAFSYGEFAARSIPGAEFAPVEFGTHLLWISDEADKLTARRIAFLRAHAPR